MNAQHTHTQKTLQMTFVPAQVAAPYSIMWQSFAGCISTSSLLASFGHYSSPVQCWGKVFWKTPRKTKLLDRLQSIAVPLSHATNLLESAFSCWRSCPLCFVWLLFDPPGRRHSLGTQPEQGCVYATCVETCWDWCSVCCCGVSSFHCNKFPQSPLSGEALRNQHSIVT